VTGFDPARRSALAAIVAVAVAVATGVAFAQDPRASTVQKTARDWLALADKLDAAMTWSAAGPRFQQAISVDNWTAGLRRQRGPRGAIVQRTVVMTTFSSSFRGLPEGGNYALVHFRSSFENHPNGGEDVTLELGPDNVWRVIGYVIQ